MLADSTRYYPFRDAACHLLGFVSNTDDVPDESLPGADLKTFRQPGKVGRSGLEQQFQESLRGIPGTEVWAVDPSGFTHERVEGQPPLRGKALRTTLDIEVQVAAERAIGNKSGAAVVLDVATGEVLALASRPGFDLNLLSPVLTRKVDQDIRAREAWINRATQGLYPPGSTFKIVTALALLRHGQADASTVISCTGSFQVGRRTFHCNNRSGHGSENLVGALCDSCNVFFYDLGIKLGIEGLAEEARLLGLSQPTGIQLPAETRSMLVPDPEWKRKRFAGESWFLGDTANFSIGQGFLLVTPLQMACLTASVARGETRTQPTLIPLSSENQLQHGGQPLGLSPEQLALVREGMYQAGLRGTARLASSPGRFQAAGKTGTAQIKKGGQPTTLAWYVGYAPAENPQVAVSVLIEGDPEGETNYAGGSTAGPIARRIFETALRSYSPSLPSP